MSFFFLRKTVSKQIFLMAQLADIYYAAEEFPKSRECALLVAEAGRANRAGTMALAQTLFTMSKLLSAIGYPTDV